MDSNHEEQTGGPGLSPEGTVAESGGGGGRWTGELAQSLALFKTRGGSMRSETFKHSPRRPSRT